MITEIADATGQLLHLVDDLLHQTQTRRLEAAINQASTVMKNLSLLFVLMGACGAVAAAQSTNIVVTVTPPPTVHTCSIPAGSAAAATFVTQGLAKLDPQYGSIPAGQAFKSMIVVVNADGSYTARVTYR